MIIFVAIGGSVGVVSVVIVVTAIVCRLRHSGKKDQLSNSQKPEKQMNNEDIFPQYDDAIHDPKSPEDSSSQKSDYYCELAEIKSNDIAAEEVYEQIWFNHVYEFLLTRYGFIWPSRYSTKFMICFVLFSLFYFVMPADKNYSNDAEAKYTDQKNGVFM